MTLQFWSRFPTPIQEVEEKNLPVFMERSAPIKVERTLAAVDYGQLVEKITTAFTSDTAPDVFTMGSPDVVTYAHPGSALQLDAFSSVRKEAEDFFDPPLAVGRYKEKLYGLTYYIDTRIMVYRKDLLAQEGLPTDRKELPKTWEQFREVGRFVPTSQTCSACGAVDGPKPLTVREWTCAGCGAAHDRDVNAAKNIKALRRRDLPNACGAGGSPSFGTAAGREAGTSDAGGAGVHVRQGG